MLGGVGEALKCRRIKEIVEQYGGMIDIFILCVDRDGKVGRRQRLDQIEREFGNNRNFLAENAWEEIEAWILAGLKLPEEWKWLDVREAINVKEEYFEPLAKQRGVADGPGGGRMALGQEAARNTATVRLKCRDDFGSLASRLEAIL